MSLIKKYASLSLSQKIGKFNWPDYVDFNQHKVIDLLIKLITPIIFSHPPFSFPPAKFQLWANKILVISH